MKLTEAVSLLTDQEMDRCDEALRLIELVLTECYGPQKFMANWIVVSLELLLTAIVKRAQQ